MAQGSKGHGNRKYLQILLSPHRGALFVEHMEKDLDMKPSAWIREMVYTYLSKNVDKAAYAEAKKLDEQEWKKSVQNRLEGRALSKLLKHIQKEESES